ncbi:MAG: AraC family transcriptional regulator [Fibrobacteria bacterium]|nr:AraC family transcriptional regulator [Fibrobacteria bacterium]
MRHSEPPEAYQDRLTASLQYLESHLGSDFSLDAMAWHACLSPFHFHRLFRKLVGVTPGEHLRHRRLDSAARALLGSSLPVGEIARHFGYASLQGFMRAFRDHFHTTPSEYRHMGIPAFLSAPIELQLGTVAPGTRFSEPVAKETSARTLVGLSRSGLNDGSANRKLVWQALGRLGDQARQQPWIGVDRFVQTPEGETYQFFVGLETDNPELAPPGLEILRLPARTEAHVLFSGRFDELWAKDFHHLWCHLLPGYGMRPEASSWKRSPSAPSQSREPVALQIPLAA